MQAAQPQSRVQYTSLFRIGAVIGLLAAIMWGVQTWRNQPATVATSQQATASTAPKAGDILLYDSVIAELGQIELTVETVDGDSATVVDNDGDKFSLGYILANMVISQEQEANRNAARMMEVIEKRRQSGYYEQNCPPRLFVRADGSKYQEQVCQ
jgi:hypothetical protein